MNKMSLFDYLNEMEDILEKSKTAAFSNKISVDKSQILEIIRDMRLSLPKEIQTAQRIMTDQEKILDQAHSRAQMIIDDAEEEVQRMISEHEVFRRAADEADKIVLDAERIERDLKLNALDFADDLLVGAERRLKEHIEEFERINTAVLSYYNDLSDTIYERRQQLKGF